MTILSITTDVAGQIGVKPRRIAIVSSDSLTTVMSAGYLNTSNTMGYSIDPTDVVDMVYSFSSSSPKKYVRLQPVILNGEITLVYPIGEVIIKDVTLAATALASSGHVNIVDGVTGVSYKVRDIKMNYGAAGLSGGGGNRLVTITDGTTVYNNAGITAALLGTPVNTVWGGSGNPLPGTVAANTATVAGADLYAVYSGGTTDFGTGSVSITVTIERVA